MNQILGKIMKQVRFAVTGLIRPTVTACANVVINVVNTLITVILVAA